MAAVVAVAIVASVPASATASPRRPGQESPSEGDQPSTTERALVASDVDMSGDPAAVTGTLSDLNANVEEQLSQLEAAESAVAKAVDALAEADAVIAGTQLRIEELTVKSDEAVVAAFVNPPAQDAIDALTADTVADATMKHALLDMRADELAARLEELGEARAKLEEAKAVQETRLAKAQAARAEAEAALGDLQAAVSQQTQFVMRVKAQLEADSSELAELAARDPAAAARIRELNALFRDLQEAARIEAAQRALAEAARRAVEQGKFLCPVRGPVQFTDTWGAARSGGRSHQGTDMLAATGTPTIAPVAGRVVHKQSGLGGMSWWVYGDDGNSYYGAHLSAYENVGVGWVEGGTVIGYVGDTGNAAGTPHLHFEFHPGGGGAVNPYGRLVDVC